MKNLLYISLGIFSTLAVLYFFKDQRKKEPESLIKQKVKALYNTAEFKKLLKDKEFNEVLQTQEFLELGYIFGRDFVLDQLGL